MRQNNAAVEAGHCAHAVSRPAQPLAVDRPAATGRAAPSTRCGRDHGRRDRRCRDRGRGNGLLHAPVDPAPGDADRARPGGPWRDRPERRPAHDLLRAAAVRHRRRVRGGPGDRGSARIRRRARPARPDDRRDRHDRPGGSVHRPHGHVQPEPPAGPPAQQRCSGAAVACARRRASSRRRPSSWATSRRSSGRSTRSCRRRPSGHSSRPTTTDTAPSSPTARAASTAACSCSRCSKPSSADTPIASAMSTGPTSSGSS